MYNNFSLEHPYVLLLVLVFFIASKYFNPLPTSYYIPHFYQYLPHTNKKGYLKSILKWTVITFAMIALSTPVIYKEIDIIKEDSIDIVLSIDTSGSMSTIGFNELNNEQNRLDVVKEVVNDFITSRKNDRIGLVLFGTTTAVASPLSYDNEVQMNIIEHINIGDIGKSTALIDSIVTSISLLENSKSKSKVIILLSDGDDSSSKAPLSIALKLAKKHQIKIYTISIGESNNNMLQVISSENGAESFDATDKDDLAQVYETINALESSSTKHHKVKIVEHIYFYFLALSVVSAIMLLILVQKSEDF